MIIKAVKRIFNSDKICRSYSDLNFGVFDFAELWYLSAPWTAEAAKYTVFHDTAIRS